MTISTDGTCWYPDGSTVAPDVPCNTTAAANGDATSCCGSEALCMANGLCLSWGILSRGSCTDSSWGKGCTQYCKTQNEAGGVRLLTCSVDVDDWTKDEFACNGADCSNSSDTFTLTSNTVVVARPTQLASLAAAVGAEVVTTTGSGSSTVAVASATDAGSCSLANQGADDAFTSADMAGVGVGVGVPLLLAFLGAVWLWRREVSRSRTGPVDATQYQYVVGGGDGGEQIMQLHQHQHQQYQEIGTDGARAELPSK